MNVPKVLHSNVFIHYQSGPEPFSVYEISSLFNCHLATLVRSGKVNLGEPARSHTR